MMEDEKINQPMTELAGEAAKAEQRNETAL